MSFRSLSKPRDAIYDHVRIENLRQITQLPSITNIKSKVLKLFGHIKRKDHRVSKICLEGMINGKRNRGRPNKRWRDKGGSSYHMLVRILLQAETAINDELVLTENGKN